MNTNDYFIREAKQIIKSNPGSGPYYVWYMDITNFHTVNQYYGTGAGDIVLKQLEDFLLQYPTIQLCCHIFADLFLCLCLPEKGTKIEDMIDDFDREIQIFLTKQKHLYPACSLNAAGGICPVEEDNIVPAIDGANAARKMSKKNLATQAVLYDQSMRDELIAQYENEREIYDALQESRFCFYLQPKVDLTNGEIIGAEALARRLGKEGEVIYPDKFLELMENSGAVIELDKLICRQVCAFLADRLSRGQPVVCVSVNLSRLHIQNPESASEFHAIAMEYNIPPDLLEFELTETILLEEFSGAKQLINQLRAYGYKVSIDDFGSGYAGINIWQELSFDCLKLDRKFLSDSEELKRRNEALVPNLINIAQRLHIQVLCEGVETEDQCIYLMQLGCTVAQGFYFSRPLPPKELCHICEELDRKYPLPPSLVSVAEEPPEAKKINTAYRCSNERVKRYLLVVLTCALFLGICIIGVMTVNRNRTNREFTRMVTETLNAYTNGQREKTLTEINGITDTLKSLSVLILENDTPAFIDAYLSALNEDNTEITYMYISKEDYEAQLSQGLIHEEDLEVVRRLMQGENVVTPITYSQRMGGIYCIGIGVPVMRKGEFIGAVRGIVDAKSLISTALFDPAQGEITNVFLTNGDSLILPISSNENAAPSERLLDRLERNGIKDSIRNAAQAALASQDSQARSVRLGIFGGSPYYLSTTSLKYNDWHLVVCLKADTATKHFQYIVNNARNSILILFGAVLLASVVLIYYVRKMQHKISLEEQRYLLLERFSDTVLFDYDCAHDTIRFTSNAPKFLRIHDLAQRNFLLHLDQVYVYAGDQNELKKILNGNGEENDGEVRIRLMRPDGDTCFWCLVQYQYLYEGKHLVSVIGKITDIDEHMRHEDYLLRMSETDGLTGLLNKNASEKRVSETMKRVSKGILFIIDVDNFKDINDRYGHAAGDMALRFLGECMHRTFRESDVMGRIGGDELLIFAENIDSMITARKKVKLLQMHLTECTETGIPPCTVSIGAAGYPSDGKTYAELYDSADRAMYAAKKKGNSCFSFYSEI